MSGLAATSGEAASRGEDSREAPDLELAVGAQPAAPHRPAPGSALPPLVLVADLSAFVLAIGALTEVSERTLRITWLGLLGVLALFIGAKILRPL